MKQSFPWLAAALLAVVFLCAPCARGQGGVMQDAGPMGLPVVWRQVGMSLKGIGFDADQISTAQVLYRGYRAAVKSAGESARQMQEKLRAEAEGKDGGWETYAKDRNKTVQAYVAKVDALEQGLKNDLKALCTPAQEERFVSVERAVLRDKSRVFAVAPGENLDLPAMLDALKVPHTEGPVADALNAWEPQLDRLLRERDTFIRSAMKMMMETDERDMEKMMKAFTEFRALSLRIGDLNRKVARQIETLLAEEKAEKFSRDVEERSFSRIYGPSRVTRAIATAKQHADLTPEQRAALDEIGAAYAKEAEPINRRWAKAADDTFREITMPELMMYGEQTDPDSAKPFVTIRNERRAADEKYYNKIKAILKENQQDAIADNDRRTRADDMPEFIPDVESTFKDRMKDWTGEADDE